MQGWWCVCAAPAGCAVSRCGAVLFVLPVFGSCVQVRPVPLEIRIQGFDVSHLGARLLAMARPTYGAMANLCSPGNQGVVFVPTRKQAQLTAIDMVAFAGADARPDSFLHAGPGTGESIVAALTAAGINDPALLHCASFGVAYYHEAMTAAEKGAIEALYKDGLISVVVATVALAWGFPLTAAVVVIMDTQQYDGREHRYVGYPIADMLQMMGRASRPGAASGTCVILCHSSRCVTTRFIRPSPPATTTTTTTTACLPRTACVCGVGVVESSPNRVPPRGWLSRSLLPLRLPVCFHLRRKEYFKRFLYDPLPVESHLDRVLADHLNAEIVTRNVTSKQDAVDYLTWTFFYRRLPKNPNYYNLQGVTKAHLSDFLSELVETTLQGVCWGFVGRPLWWW